MTRFIPRVWGGRFQMCQFQRGRQGVSFWPITRPPSINLLLRSPRNAIIPDWKIIRPDPFRIYEGGSCGPCFAPETWLPVDAGHVRCHGGARSRSRDHPVKLIFLMISNPSSWDRGAGISPLPLAFHGSSAQEEIPKRQKAGS